MELQNQSDIKKNFNAYWLKYLEPALWQKEKLRQKYVSRFWLMLLISLIVIPMICIISYLLSHQSRAAFNPNILFLMIAGAVFILRAPYHQYKKQIKRDIMPIFIAFFDGFEYRYAQGLTADEIEDSRIFPSFDTIYADDCFEGCYQGVHIRVMEEKLKRYYRTKNGRKEVTVFEGIAVELDLKKMFSSRTIVIKDAGIFNRIKHFSNMERIKLEDPTFEKIFEVFGTDQFEARRFLTPAFMERVIKLKNLYKGKSVQLSFYEGKLLIAVSTNQDMFEPFSFFKTNINKEKIDRVFEQFLTIFEIIRILKI